MAATPKDAAQDVLDRARALLTLDAPGVPDSAREDLRRMALAMGVAAIDTFLHWAVRRVDLDDLRPKLARLSVPFEELLAMGDRSVAARAQDVLDRPRVRARNVLNETILTMTFQTASQVDDALAMIGVKEKWPKLSQAIVPTEAPADIKARLNAMAHHRNRIVHEGDLRRLVRPQQVVREAIARPTVDDHLDWIGRFVDALDVVCP